MNAVQWGGGNEMAHEYGSKWVEAHEASAIVLIRAYKGKGTNLETGLPVETPSSGSSMTPLFRLWTQKGLLKH